MGDKQNNNSSRNLFSLHSRIKDSFVKQKNREFNSFNIDEFYTETEKTQVILVIGSGASRWSNISSWEDIGVKIIKLIFRNFNENVLADEFNRLSSGRFFKYNPDRDKKVVLRKAVLDVMKNDKVALSKEEERGEGAGEDNLLLGNRVTIERVISHFSRYESIAASIKKLVADLIRKDKSKNDNPVQLGYSLVAHMFKHGLITHIINFNFDGLLNDALSLEMYENPVYKRESVREYSSRNGSLEQRKVIYNIHGSIESYTSLRVGEHETHYIEHQERNELVSLFDLDGSVETTVFSVGYSWSDLDLLSLLTSIDKVKVYPYLLKDEKTPVFHEKNMFFPIFLKKGIAFNFPSESAAIDEFIWALSSSLICDINEEKYVSHYVPRVFKHVLIGKLFGPDLSQSSKSSVVRLNSDHSQEKQFLLEFAIALFSSKFKLSLANLSKRSSIHNSFQRIKAGGNLRLVDVFSNFSKEFKDFLSSFLLTEILTLPECGADLKHAKSVIIEPIMEVIRVSEKGSVRKPSFRRVEDGFLLEIDRNTKFHEFIANSLYGIFWNSEEVNLVSGIDPRADFMFRDPQPIGSWSTFKMLTKYLLNKAAKMYVVAENGQWMAEYSDLISGKEIFLINAFHCDYINEFNPGPANEKVKNILNLNLSIASMFWKSHNNHMTIAVDENGELFGGVYYLRRSKGMHVSPVFIQNIDDLKYALRVFQRYVDWIVLDQSVAEATNRSTNNLDDIAKFKVEFNCEI